MASIPPSVTAMPHNGQSELEQDRKRWFAEFGALKARFEAEKENINAKFTQQQRDACHDLDDEARFVDTLNLPQKARELLQKYQHELRSHRYAACQQRCDAEEKERGKRETIALRDHHIVFPVGGGGGYTSRNTVHAPNSGMLGRTPTNSSAQMGGGRVGPAARGSPSVMATSAPPQQARQPLPQGPMMPNQPVQQRPTNGIPGHGSSAPMPSQLDQQIRQSQQINQGHPNQGQNWIHHNQGPQQGSPRTSTLYHPTRPVNTPAANGPPRVLPSQPHVPTLGSNHYGPPRAGPGQPAIGPQPNLADRSNRVPLPPTKSGPMSSRGDKLYPGDVSDISPGSILRPEDMLRLSADFHSKRHKMAKRKSDASEMSSGDADPKRARTDTPHSIAPRTITFAEVYQNGKAEYKHNIVKYEDVFYILRCDEHGVHFKQNALAAAAKHLHGASHGHQKKEHKLAVETIGFHVVDCTEELAALNNECVRLAFESGYKPLNQLHGPKSGGKRQSAVNAMAPVRDPSVSDSSFQAPPNSAGSYQTKLDARTQEDKHQDVADYIMNPIPGDIYHAKWPRSNKLYIVMILGWTSLKMCGWDGWLSDTQLCNKKIRPTCYTYNEDGIGGWAPGYRDGELRMLDRDVPVLWFEKQGNTRLGWLGVKFILKPLLLDDPDRPTDPLDPSNQARKKYAETRGYDSFEAMLAHVQGGQTPTGGEAESTAEATATTTTTATATVAAAAAETTAAKLPSFASASDSDPVPDVDMYDFGDNPPPADDSEDEDYVEPKSQKSQDSDDDMADIDDYPTTPQQPLRRSTQEVRPTSRLSESSWMTGRSGAAAGTRLSAKKDKAAAADKEDVTMDDAAQVTPSKDRVVAKGNAIPVTANNNEGLPNTALETPATLQQGSSENAKNALPSAAGANPRTEDSASMNTASPHSTAESAAERPVLTEIAKSNAPQRLNAQESVQTAASQDGENHSQIDHASMASLAQSAMKAASKSPSLDKRVARVSPKLQIANLVNGTASSEKAARRPLPSEPSPDMQHTGAVLSQPAPLRNPLPQKPSQGIHLDQMARASQHPSPALSTKSIKEIASPALNSPIQQPPRSTSAESTARRPDPRMSIANMSSSSPHEDQERGAIKQTVLSTGNGTASGSSTPKVLTHASLVNSEQWRAVRTSESPRTTPAALQSPVIDRSAAASPALGGKRDTENFFDVSEFHEGSRHWAQPGKFLRFAAEDESSSMMRSKEEDGMEAVVDAGQVQAAKMTGTTVQLELKTDNSEKLEQRLVFETNSLTGSQRGARLQATKFYRWISTKNPDIQHLY
ncbi:hypothetical protein CORC01_05013 [Colletotrichum orchidophilum]|uniref:Uncharacterized protein n=1 Tax=Colletotrichum orchidophilum TaxID=1209926 RepID=A0A1G4BEA2_9PEZI|nr:uncharacterized protein CORC01_05013 [Colletotrichum orchidophilum]OHE99655.1 hypothetical protein CORC01_05013 [Colletotrichum orchidophilum]